MRYSDRDELAVALANTLATTLRSALAARPRASLVVSGGSTPVPLFRALRKLDLEWARVDVTLADERWVAPEHPDSNERLIRTELLQEQASAARFVPLRTPEATPEEGTKTCETAQEMIERPFDAVILGMGDDGHTASLFPLTPTLDEGLSLTTVACCLPCRPTTAPHPRMTLTLRALLNTRNLILHIAGESKLATLQQALHEADTRTMPVRALFTQDQVSVNVYWAP
ncbi:6-phosphogluconolactonase [Alkalilimnicola ehrlichii]|uniref:6-phosphogluconolactonase n=2 Tax=Alkalilimnicola ehrlichii TaxID=351052 RepID=A0A3E0WHQ2_9GAMM|nr:6-phosphogluconolactonase [Alkalilimnicola ehrlichii]RFA32434.1 6-phosphogluconolactonase [Alkalilimnicola ehrlichii]